MFLDSDFPDDRGVMQSRLRMVLESGPGSGNSSDVLRSHRINPLCGFILRSRGGGALAPPAAGAGSSVQARLRLCATIMRVKSMILRSSTYVNSTCASDPVYR